MWGWIDRIPEYTPMKKRYMLSADNNGEWATFVVDARNEKQARNYVTNMKYNVHFVERIGKHALSIQIKSGDIIHFSKR